MKPKDNDSRMSDGIERQAPVRGDWTYEKLLKSYGAMIKANAEVVKLNVQHLEENIRLSARLEETLDLKAAQDTLLRELRRREKVWLVLLKTAKAVRFCDHDKDCGCLFCEAIHHVEEALGDYDEGGRR